MPQQPRQEIAPPSGSLKSIGSLLGFNFKIPLGTRVVLSGRRHGIVRFHGKLKYEAGEWYGVALDEAKGTNDGTVEGDRYFECAPNHGLFVRRKELSIVKEDALSRSKSMFTMTNTAIDDGQHNITSNDSTLTSTSENGSIKSLPSPCSIRHGRLSLRAASDTIAKKVGNQKSTATSATTPTPASSSTSNSPPRQTKSLERDYLKDKKISMISRLWSYGTSKKESTGEFLDQDLGIEDIKKVKEEEEEQDEEDQVTREYKRRIAQLEKEMNQMKSNHENVVAVLRATSTQHAAKVLALRTQVTDLLDANRQMDKWLVAKDKRIQQLEKQVFLQRELQQQHHSKDKDTQIISLQEELLSLLTQKFSLLQELQDMRELFFFF